MKVWTIKLLYLTMHTVTGTMDFVGKLFYWFLFSTAIGFGLTIGSLSAILYVIYER